MKSEKVKASLQLLVATLIAVIIIYILILVLGRVGFHATRVTSMAGAAGALLGGQWWVRRNKSMLPLSVIVLATLLLLVTNLVLSLSGLSLGANHAAVGLPVWLGYFAIFTIVQGILMWFGAYNYHRLLKQKKLKDD